MDWRIWFLNNPGDEDRYVAFKARLAYEIRMEKERRAMLEQRAYEKSLNETAGDPEQS